MQVRVRKYKKSALTFLCRKNLTKQAHTPESSLPQSDFDELKEHLGELTLVSMTFYDLRLQTTKIFPCYIKNRTQLVCIQF